VDRRLPVVIGTTGWSEHVERLRTDAVRAGIGVVASANFSIGVNVFQLVVAEAARLMHAHREYGSWIHEAHHAAKKDAPSGTALALARAVEASGFGVEVSSTRAGHIPGTHTLGFDAPAETITLTHTARDRTAFARGALEAAKWIRGRRGWYGMRDMLEL
jgi:4-hydroxy-tetrahydrodipicolinate reductase